MIRKFDTGATKDTAKGKHDYEGFLSPLVIWRFGQYMHGHRLQADGTMRDSDNWQKGIPKDVHIKSLFRHFLDVWALHRGLEVIKIRTSDGEETYISAGEIFTKDTNQTFVNIEDALCAIIFAASGYLHEILKNKGKLPDLEDMAKLYPGKIWERTAKEQTVHFSGEIKKKDDDNTKPGSESV